MDLSKIIAETGQKMDEAISHFKEELKSINTGRASSVLVEGVVVQYYGTPTPLKQIASIAIPDAHQIAITPWDRNALADIESAIRSSDLGLAPTNDGNAVRLNLPPMTEERRGDLNKMVGKMSEETKISLRNQRGDAWEKIQEAEKKSELTEDDRDQAKKDLNDLVSKKNELVEQITKEKQQEIIKV